MNERIVEIIVYVISELKHKKQISEVDVDELQKQGYTSTEISTAFSWIADRLEFNQNLHYTGDYVNNESFRIFNEEEKNLFTKEALAELLQMHSLGLLTNENIEQIIEHSIIAGYYKIDSEQLKYYVANIIFNAQLNNTPGSRLMLSGDDKIN